MSNQKITQMKVVSKPSATMTAGVEEVALFKPDGTPFPIPSAPVNATTSTKGIVNQAAAQANSSASDVAGLVADFNALLAKLRTAGIIAT